MRTVRVPLESTVTRRGRDGTWYSRPIDPTSGRDVRLEQEIAQIRDAMWASVIVVQIEIDIEEEFS